MTPKKTLGEFIIDNQNQFEYSTGELSRLLNAIRLASKAVNHEVNKAGLVDIIGATNQINHSDVTQQKLDVFANHAFKRALINRDIVCGFASEEEENFISISSTNSNNNNNYVVLVDPLDGSSNIDTNVSVGTIFSIYRRLSSNTNAVSVSDFLQKGRYYTTASGTASTAMGYRTTASDFGSTVIGQHNKADETPNPNIFSYQNTAFVIGNGGFDSGGNYVGTTVLSNAFKVLFDGTTTIAGDLSINSDARLKANIISLGSTLAKLLQIDGKTYTMKKDENKKQKIGVLAQDIEKVFPELVSESNGIKSVNYQGLVPVLINALKEQDSKMNEQETKLNKQQAEIDELKAIVTKLITP